MKAFRGVQKSKGNGAFYAYRKLGQGANYWCPQRKDNAQAHLT